MKRLLVLFLLIPSIAFGWGTGGSGLTNATLPELSFSALTYDPATFEMQGVRRGTDMTITRTTTSYALDHEGIYRSVPAGSGAADSVGAIWQGSRKVENLAEYSEDFSQSGSWTASNITATSSNITASAGNGTILQTYTGSNIDVIFSVELQRATGTGNIDITVDGGSTWTTVTTTSSYKRFTVNDTNATNPQFGVRIVTSGDSVNIRKAQLENVTGQTTTTIPSEYIPTTTAAVTKYYANSNGRTVASNVVTEATGAALATVPSLLVAPALTNSALDSNDLDVAGSNWAAINGGSAALDAVGLTGDANTASTVTDDDDAGASFEGVQQDITIPNDSNDNVLRVFVKKDSDTSRFPRINLELSGGTGQNLKLDFKTTDGTTNVNSSVGTVAYEVNDITDVDGNVIWLEVLLSVQNNSTGNTTASIKIFPAVGSSFPTGAATATGSIIVGNVELYKGKTIAEVRSAPPIITTSSAVPTGAQSNAFDNSNISDTSGLISFSVYLNGADNIIGTWITHDGTDFQLDDGTTQDTVTGALQTWHNVAVWWHGSQMAICLNGTCNSAVAYDGAMTSLAAVASSPSHTMLMRDLKIHNGGSASQLNIKAEALTQ